LSPTRDFNFVQDTVSGFIKAAEASEAIGQVINIGSGAEISIGKLAQLILELMGKSSLPVVQEDQRVRPEDSEVNRLWAENRKAQEILGWAPQHTLREGLEVTIEWVRSHLDNYRVESYAV
jgi:nucleoside-diphosphate-sugar epimerase